MKKAATLFFVLIFGASLCAQEIGLQLYSLRKQFKKDVTGTLDIIKSWGITNLEGGKTYGLPIEDFKKEVKDRGLDVVSVGAGYNDLKKNIKLVIENAKAFNAKYVMCPWIPHKENHFDIDDVKEAVSVFNIAGKQLKEEDITLAYHTHGYEFRPYKDGTLFDYMAKNAIDFAFEMDVFWVQHGGVDPLALLNQYPDKFILLHLKDMQLGIKGNNSGHEDVETNVVLGTGQVNIAGVVKRARELGMVSYMFIEDECSRVLEQVPKSLKFLENLD